MTCPNCDRALERVDVNEDAAHVGGRWRCPECNVIRTGITLTMQTADERANPEPKYGRIIVVCQRCKAVAFGCSNALCDRCCMHSHSAKPWSCHFQQVSA